MKISKISIELDDYEVANLLQVLKIIPNNGEYIKNIKDKIAKAIEEVDTEKFHADVMPNSGMDIKAMERHVNFLKWQQRNRPEDYKTRLVL